jgi:hypothetical protein
MNLLVAALLHFLKPFGNVVNYDGGISPVFWEIAIPILVILGIGIVILIALAVRFLVRLRNKNNKHD